MSTPERIARERSKAIEMAVGQIEKQFGKGSIMRLGAQGAVSATPSISTGAISIDYALGIGGVPRGRGSGLDAENRRQSLFFEELAVKIERSEHDAFATREVASRSFDTLPYGGQIAQAESSVSCLAILCNGRK